MNARNVVAIVIFAFIVIFGTIYVFIEDRPAQTQRVGSTDLVSGQAYKVADFKTCNLPGGTAAIEWHFGGAHRSLRNQLTPRLDGRGRRIFRVVKNDSTLPAGHMRLRSVTESDPTVEGFSFGNYSWSGLVVEYNGRVERQSVVGPCGPAR